MRLSRSKTSTKSRGCAWLQFSHAEVARIAADAMNGYMLFGQTIKCHLVKPSEVHSALFKNANKRMKRKPWAKIEAERHNKERSPEEAQRRLARLIKKDGVRKKAIAAKGIEYEYEPLAAAVPKRATKTIFD